MKDALSEKVLLEHDGILVNEVEVKDSSTGSHFKITLTSKGVVMKVNKFGLRGKPSVACRVLLPGENRLESAGGVRLLLPIPYWHSTLQASFPFIVTYSLKLNISLAVVNVLGDLSEEFAELGLKHGTVGAGIWYWRQILASACPFVCQVIRQVLMSVSGMWTR